MEQVQSFAPEIAVEQPAGTGVANGGSKDFGSVNKGANTSLTFTIKNTGNFNLTGLGITIDGADAAMFSVTVNPTAPVTPGGSTTFTVRFAPTSTGAKTAALHIASNDADDNPFDIILTGTGVNTPPVANDQPVSTNEDTAKAITLTASDINGDSLTFNVVALPASGKLYDGTGTGGHLIAAGDLPYTVTDASHKVTYDPNANYNGPDSFTFKANDGLADSNTATVSVTVDPVADTPSVTNATTNEDTQTTAGLVITRNAADGTEVTHFQIHEHHWWHTLRSNGTSAINNGDFITLVEGNAGLKFTPAANSFANGSFQVQAS